ncbi:UDP-glycosyltransferase 84B1-like [Mercurialis annua]|uniref:UDP-glycosyltransferase 84B1-like n=1 Tax=Mercurialis annua TaxID=3986 RepID=UPI00215EF28B|nr:UDP-glycosyltransferase 84B1-like [Mercurialis annua]
MVAEENIHFLLVTVAMQGHLNPTFRLAKRLVSKGIHVTLATNDTSLHHITENITPKPPGITLTFFSDGLSPEFNRVDDFELYIKSMRTIGSKNLSNLISKLTTPDRSFRCIIFGPFTPWVADIAAEKKIPCAMLWIQSSTTYSVFYNFLKNPNLFPSFENPEEYVNLPGLQFLQVKDLPPYILPSCPPVFFELLSDIVHAIDKVKWVLGHSFTELEEEVVNSMDFLHPIYPIGPLVSPFLLNQDETTSLNDINVDLWKAENSCIEWLDKKPNSSVIYISFGSVIEFSQKQLENLSIGLKNSNRPFLWVIKPKQKNSDEKKKPDELPDSFLVNTKANGMVVTWCDQEKVLMHKAVGCFITHCGWNSVLEAMVAGVPVIAYPGGSDQATVAKFLVDVLKIGVRLNIEDGVASSEEVERCIMQISDGPEAAEMKKRVLGLQELAKKVVAEGGSSDKNIKQFISDVIGKTF